MDPRNLENIGPYKVTRFIDEGAFAWVYEVIDPKFAGRRLALKMLKPEAAAGDEFRRFERESQLLAGVDHPSIVTIFDFGKDPETEWFYYTMTFVDGPTLKSRLREGALSVEDAVNLFIDLLDGLHHLHERSIIHRDIKPANVLIGSDGRGRVSDLGIARVETERSQTRTGMAVGTALYMSPEQARGRPVDARSDLFAVGLTLYETLTANVVYDHVDDIDSTSGMDVLIYIGRLDQQKGAEFKIRFPDSPPIPEPIRAVIRKSCQLRAENRYADAAEMRDALRQALHAPAAPVSSRRLDPRLLAGGGAVAAVVVGFAAYWFGVHVPGLEREAANQAFGLATALDERSAAMVEATLDLEPPPPSDLVEAVRERRERAGEYLFDGTEDLELGVLASANANFNRAFSHFQGSCDDMVTSFLVTRADAQAAAVGSRAEVMREGGAPDVAGEAWGKLEASMAGMGATPADVRGCDAADAQMARIAAGLASTVLADDLVLEMTEVWPRLAAEARDKAVTGRKQAEAELVDATEYKLAMREGKRFQLRGDQRVRAGDHTSARDAFLEAEKSFQTAFAIVPAAQARDATRTLAEEVARAGQEIGGTVRLISRADAKYASREWKESAGIYREALEDLRGARDAKKQLTAARGAETEAMTIREAAVEQGAERSAANEFKEAETTADAAIQAIAEQRFADAEQGFMDARDQFRSAREAAIQAMSEASAERTALRELRGGLVGGEECDSLGTDVAQEACAEADGGLATGTEALEAMDAPTAQRSFTAARESFARARTAQGLWEETRPRPPELVRRSPQREKVEVTRNERRRFEVEATDPNDDDLSFSWSLDGRRLPETEAALDFTIERGGTLAVTVDDGRGGQLTEQWQLAVVNRSPTLKVTPAANTVVLDLGASQTFRVVAADPDGDPVSTRFKLGGREVGRGNTFAFDASKAGTYNLEVVASDPGGQVTRTTRRIVVNEASAAPTARQRIARTTPPAPAPTRAPEPGLPSLSGWQGGVVEALTRYESALEAGDIRELERVLTMGSNSPVRAFYTRKFQRGDKIQVAIQLRGDIEGDGKRATIDFDQTETSGSRTRTYRYRAQMIQRSGGAWQIEKRERRR